MYNQIAHRRGWKIELQRLPVVAVIERNKYSVLCASVEQALSDRILAHNADNGALRQTAHNLLPASAVVVGAICVRAGIMEAVHHCISRASVMMRSLNRHEDALRRYPCWRNVAPGLTAILS